MRVPRTKLLLTIAILLAVLSIVCWFVFRSGSQTLVLPDGSRLTLAQVDYGKANYEFHRGSLTARILHAVTPRSWIMEMRTNRTATASSFKGKTVMRAQRGLERTGAATNSLVLWFDGVSTNSFLDIRVLPEDEDRIVWDSNTEMWHSKLFSGMNGWGRLRSPLINQGGVQIPVFPRRKEFVRLNVFLNEGTEAKPVGQLRIRNPAYAAYPVWEAQELPATTRYDGYEFTLLDLSNIPKVPSRAEPEYSPLTARIVVTRQGQPSHSWNVGSFELEDATGNRWSAPFYSTTKESNAWTLRATHVVPTNEVLKLRATLWRLENFSADELWEIADVPLPEEGHFTTVTNISTSRDGFTLKFLGISERDVKFPGAQSSGSSRLAHFEVSPPFSLAAKFWRLSVVDILTEKGTSIKRGNAPWVSTLGPKPSVPLTYSTTGSRARLIFALAKPHTIEFLVRARNAPFATKH